MNDQAGNLHGVAILACQRCKIWLQVGLCVPNEPLYTCRVSRAPYNTGLNSGSGSPRFLKKGANTLSSRSETEVKRQGNRFHRSEAPGKVGRREEDGTHSATRGRSVARGTWMHAGHKELAASCVQRGLEWSRPPSSTRSFHQPGLRVGFERPLAASS